MNGVIIIPLLLLYLGAASATPSSARRKSEVIHYLEKMYDDAQTLGRPLVNGELNLLPEGSEGFANSVRCFYDTSGSSIYNNSRNLRYNLTSLTINSKIVAIRLVYKQEPKLATHLYEVGEGEDMDLQLLDSGDSYKEWHVMNVQNVVDSVDNTTGKRLYHLVLSVNGMGSNLEDVLQSIQPMLLVYSDDTDNIGGSTVKDAKPSKNREDSRPSERQQRRRKREVSVTTETDDGNDVKEAVVPSLEELKKLSCRRHTRTLEFSQLGWPGDQYVVTTPNKASFSFCYGSCDEPLAPETRDQYNNHATIIGLARPELARAGLSPCCVPKEITTIKIFFEPKTYAVMYVRSMPIVTSCQCL